MRNLANLAGSFKFVPKNLVLPSDLSGYNCPRYKKVDYVTKPTRTLPVIPSVSLDPKHRRTTYAVSRIERHRPQGTSVGLPRDGR